MLCTRAPWAPNGGQRRRLCFCTHTRWYRAQEAVSGAAATCKLQPVRRTGCARQAARRQDHLCLYCEHHWAGSSTRAYQMAIDVYLHKSKRLSMSPQGRRRSTESATTWPARAASANHHIHAPQIIPSNKLTGYASATAAPTGATISTIDPRRGSSNQLTISASSAGFSLANATALTRFISSASMRPPARPRAPSRPPVHQPARIHLPVNPFPWSGRNPPSSNHVCPPARPPTAGLDGEPPAKALRHKIY